MNKPTILSALLSATLLSSTSQAAFHFMQIEEVIGGINGNNTAQAIQLRTRLGNQNVLAGTRLLAWDANGANPILLFDFTSTYAPAADPGDSILLVTPAFNLGMLTTTPAFAPDFTLTNPIPASYLSGGKVTFGADNQTTFYWSFAFGSYLGTNTGTTDNDANGLFGAPFASALPIGSLQGVRFTGAASALSTTNVADYALTANPATVKNASGVSYAVVPEPASAALVGLGVLFLARRRRA